MINREKVKDITLKIMGDLKWFVTYGVLISYLFFIILINIFNDVDYSFIVVSVIALFIFIGVIWNTSITLFPSLNEDSSDTDILLRGFIIFFYGIVFYSFLLVELFF